MIVTNIQSEIIDKSAIISTRRWTNSRGTAHSRMGGPTSVNHTNIQSEIIDKSAIISTQRWTNILGTAHSKMGGPTFVNEKLVHVREKNYIVLTFETKEQRRLLL